MTLGYKFDIMLSCLQKCKKVALKTKTKGGNKMIKLNGYEIQTEKFANNETRVKDFEHHIL